ncbi:MAG: tRNA (guanosine(46)-N7)-methyltransferase TrmB [Candidatus Aminicenantes bacterium]|nr:tRNA (guanosine(46)-N7)-methyltransferase TrmB [Candidatus Aminicenantes bacterium]
MTKPDPGNDYIAGELRTLRNVIGKIYYNNPYIARAQELTQTGRLVTLEDFEKVFPRMFADPSLPLVLDIGCYSGKTVVELGNFNPGINVLGIDVKYKRVVKSCRKIEAAGLQNCRIAICDAGKLVSLLPENSLLAAFIFFPDPWKKAKQQKHRLLTRQFLEVISTKLKKEGFIWLKTDAKAYFDLVLKNLEENKFTISDSLPETIADREYNTLFEEMFVKQAKPVYRAVIRKTPGTLKTV